jgi:hypothetical protein
MSTAVVSSREHCEQLATSKPLKAVHNALMGPQDVFGFIVIEELLDAVRAELYDVAGSVRVSDEIGLDA